MSEPLSEEQLNEWAALAEGATPGSWTMRDGYERMMRIDGELIPSGFMGFTRIANDVEDDVVWADMDECVATCETAEFIAAARTAVPALLTEVRRLRSELAKATRIDSTWT